MWMDARVPVVFGAEPGAGDAVLEGVPAGVPAGVSEGTHAAGCACCGVRGAAEAAFDRLFLDRVHGRVAWFRRVVVREDASGAMRAALADPVVGARFREG